MPISKETRIKKFWKKVDKSDKDGCWLWTGTQSHDGYGQCWHENKCHNAQRAAWLILIGPIESEDILVCHKCDNRLCVRLDHLFLGTHDDNMADMKNKGRSATGSRNGGSKNVHLREGELSPCAKMTNEEVRNMREDFMRGLSYYELVDKYKFTYHAIWDAVNMRTFCNVAG